MIGSVGPWGTGPFALKDGVSTLDKRAPKVTLEPNEQYWNPARRPKVRFTFDNIIPKAQAIKEVVDGTGKVDIVTELTPEEAKAVEASKHARLVANDSRTMLVGVFNRTAPDSRWNNLDLRKALNIGINRQGIIDAAARGYGLPLSSMLKEGEYGYNESIRPIVEDNAASSAALKAGGVDKITIVAGAGHLAVANALAEDLKDEGVTAMVKEGGPEGDWDIWLVEHFDWSPQYPQGVVIREFFGEDGGFRKMDTDPVLKELLAKSNGTGDSQIQHGALAEMEKRIHDEHMALFLYAPMKLYAVSNRVDFVPMDTWSLEMADTKVKD